MKIKIIFLSLLISILSAMFVYGDECDINTYNCSHIQKLEYSNNKHIICHTTCGQTFAKYLIDYTTNMIKNKCTHNYKYSNTNFIKYIKCIKKSCAFDLSYLCDSMSNLKISNNSLITLNKQTFTINKLKSANDNNKKEVVKKPVSEQPTQKRPTKTKQKEAKQPTNPKTPTTTPTEKPVLSPTSFTYEKKVVQLVNIERAKSGLGKLTLNTTLSNSARAKSQDMIDNRYFSHTSPTYGNVGNMLKKFGISYTAYGENIAYGQKTPEQVVKAWMESPGHRANILSPHFSKIGVGYVTSSSGTPYWTQQFTN